MYQPQQQSYGYQSAATNNTAAAMGAWSQPQQTQVNIFVSDNGDVDNCVVVVVAEFSKISEKLARGRDIQ